MTCYDPIPARSARDLPGEVAAERHAALRAERDRGHLASLAAQGDGGPSAIGSGVIGAGAIHRMRSVVGRRLVALGSTIDPAGFSPSRARSAGR